MNKKVQYSRKQSWLSRKSLIGPKNTPLKTTRRIFLEKVIGALIYVVVGKMYVSDATYEESVKIEPG